MRVAIHGLGRIGRQALRRIVRDPRLELVGVGDLADAPTLAHLIRHDSVHGRAPFPVSAEGGDLVLDGRRVALRREPDPGKHYGALGAEVVLECTGLATRRDQAARHLTGSVRHVVIGAPSEDADATWMPGSPAPQGAPVLDAGCPASHALAVLARVLQDRFGLESGMALAVESYQNDQRILDLPHADPRMARAAAASMIPAPCRAAACLARALPWTRSRLEAQAVRVPTPDVSLMDLTALLAAEADPESVLEAFREAAPALGGALEILDEPLVSVDLRGMEASCVLDPFLTRSLAPRLLKVLAWYDNEAAYASRLVDLCLELDR
jgi:glyceraldehyde 3-phosphate dehydrogenase